MPATVWIDCLENSALGPIWVGVNVHGLVEVAFANELNEFHIRLESRAYRQVQTDSPRTAPYLENISAYLEGRSRTFELPIDWSIFTPFQGAVLRATFAIPYGQVRTYGELARQIGRPGAARAVGRAEATNPMPLVIPCHRVIGSDGGLHGYGGRGGIPTKAWLLRLEGGELG